MKKYIYILLISFLLIIIFWYKKSSEKEIQNSKNALSNNVIFKGKINYLKISENHAFGIIGLEITESNIKNFEKKLGKKIFPYKIRNSYAEIYATVNIERKNGEIVEVVSDSSTIYYNPQNTNELGDLFLISDPINIKFIKENTKIK